jgi:hypothetical protein
VRARLKERVFAAIAQADKPIDFIDLMVAFCPRGGPIVQPRRLDHAVRALIEEGRVYDELVSVVQEKVRCRDGVFTWSRQVRFYRATREVAS